jgi:hypothetical protein
MTVFKRLVALQYELGLPVVDHYAAGLSYGEIETRLLNYSFAACDQVKSLYNVANGSTKNDQCPMSDLWVIPGYYMLALDEALETSRNLAGIDSEWLPGWLPILSSGGPSLIVCNTNGQLLRSNPEVGCSAKLMAGSIESFVRTVIRSLEQGNLCKKPNGSWEWITSPW